MWVAIAATMVLFFRVSVAAGLLLVPYIAWVSFATLLNGAIVILNRKGAAGA
jgi:tryptophan-rich sensory protein